MKIIQSWVIARHTEIEWVSGDLFMANMHVPRRIGTLELPWIILYTCVGMWGLPSIEIAKHVVCARLRIDRIQHESDGIPGWTEIGIYR